ncbi:MAG: hypothetical protein ACRD0W_17870 [Acidimicrobiales bacterium]
MSDNESRSSEVEVGVNPDTAFTAFTDELDLWWVRGPINSFGAEKLVALRCEPGVGGRLLEVYDEDSGEGCSLMIDRLAGPPVDHERITHVPWVFVDDLEAHLERARDNGATVVEGISTYGFSSYVARDLEGRTWRFAAARPTQPR